MTFLVFSNPVIAARLPLGYQRKAPATKSMIILKLLSQEVVVETHKPLISG